MKDKYHTERQQAMEPEAEAEHKKKEPRLLKVVHHDHEQQERIGKNNKATGHRRGYYSRNGYGSYEGL